MAKKHPLDIFRNTQGGFGSASRDRRTLPGKVVASTPRPGAAAADGGQASPERSAPLITAARAAAAVRAQERADAARVHSSAAIAATPARQPARMPANASARAAGRPSARPASRAGARPGAINRALLVASLVLVGGFAIYLIGANSSGAALKSSAGVGGSFSVAAASWDGTAAGRAAAEACRDVLRAGGFPAVLLGNPSAKADEYRSYDLMVGNAASKAELATLLTQIGALKNSKGAPAFASPRIVPTPNAARR